MAEGKLTLPVIYALNSTNDDSMMNLARKVKAGTVSPDEISCLVEFTKRNGGIEYAERKMEEIAKDALIFIDQYAKEKAIKDALTAYLEYVIQRNY
jgi:octaprenyl-diphosphate synthase